jgi:hypothetical protein
MWLNMFKLILLLYLFAVQEHTFHLRKKLLIIDILPTLLKDKINI